jgi:hypothetical protein
MPLHTRNAAGYKWDLDWYHGSDCAAGSDKGDLLVRGGVVWGFFERALTFLTVYSLLVEVAR